MKHSSDNVMKKLDALCETGSFEDLLIACSSILSSDDSNISRSDISKIQLHGMTAAINLNLSEEALLYTERYLDDLPEGKDANVLAMNTCTSILFSRGEYYEVEKILERWKLQTFQGDNEGDCNFLSVQASCFAMRKDYEKAAELMKQAIDLAQQSGFNSFAVSISVNLGAVLYNLERNEEALQILEKAYRDSLACNDPASTGHALATLISAMIANGDIEKAENLARSSLESALLPEEKDLRVAATLKLAKIFKLRNKLSEGISILEKTLPDLEEGVDWQLSKLFYNKLIFLYKLNKDYKKALSLLEAFKKKSDEVLSSQAEEQLTSTRKVMELSGKAREAEILAKKNTELQKANSDLQEALEHIKTLSGIIPICSYCRKMRNDEGYWNSLENYLSNHSDALLSHSVCPECLEKLMGEMKDSAAAGN